MSQGEQSAQLLKLAITVEVEPVRQQAGGVYVAGPKDLPRDLLVELSPDATVGDLTEAVAGHFKLGGIPGLGLTRRMVSSADRSDPHAVGFLPAGHAIAECGLFDGVTLTLRQRNGLPDLPLDTMRDPEDLFIVDERGTHRGRVTRLPRGVEVMLGSRPSSVPHLIVDDDGVEADAVIVKNYNGATVSCTVLRGTGVHISGNPVRPGDKWEAQPGGTISFRRDNTDAVSFIITTAEGLLHRSPIGKVRFDPAARLGDPQYRELSEHVRRIDAQPEPPEDQPFPAEQIVVPLTIVGVIYFVTQSLLSLLITPIAAVIPVVIWLRQKRMAQRRYEKARTRWVERLQRVTRELTEMAGLEEGNRKQENPAPAEWARRAYRRQAGLWGRGPNRDDFLAIALGYGQTPSRYEVKLADGVDLDDEDFRKTMEVQGRKISPDAIRPQLFDVPITTSLRDHHVGLVGPDELVLRHVRAVLLQIVCGQPPGAVGLAALLPGSPEVVENFDWLKWLPHTAAGSTLLPATRLMTGRARSNSLLAGMRDVLVERQKYRLNETRESYAVLLVHEASEVDTALLGEVIALSDGLVRVLWVGSSTDTAPVLVTSLVELHQNKEDIEESTGVVLSGDPALAEIEFAPSLFVPAPDRTARALAPLYDPQASGANAGIPRSVPLGLISPLSGFGYPDQPRPSLGKSLSAPIGVAQDGVFELDLVADGPHALIGGTTGAGKSELLQTLLSGLIGRYGPNEVNLFLVDFKGGATFAPFRAVPHVVGYVSDLDQRNVNRSLAFLRAELRRRERAFEAAGHAKEYHEYLSRTLTTGGHPIPRLIVVFDEFATIVQEFERTTLPAVIDIAQRGRSWGVHLVLATQQPTRDVVVPKVRANVNARIALRTLSPDDSMTIIDRPEATRIPRALPGRAMVTLEGGSLVEFQTAYAGARYMPQNTGRVRLTPLTIASTADAPADPDPDDAGLPGAETHLRHLIGEVIALRLPSPEQSIVMPDPLEAAPVRVRPRLRALPRHADGDAEADGRTRVAIGVVDLPHQQTRLTVEADLRRGAVLFTGPNGSGLTTALRTVAEAMAGTTDPARPFTVVCLDGGDRLTETIGDVVCCSIARVDLTTTLIDQLWLVLRSRMARVAGQAVPIGYTGRAEILVLIDGFDVLMRALAAPATSFWYARLTDLLTAGRRHGIYFALSSRSARDLDATATGALASRIALHEHYDEAGTPAEERLPGFGTNESGNLVQILHPTRDFALRPRPDLDQDLASFLRSDTWRTTAACGGDPDAVVLGVDEVSRLPVTVPLAEEHLLIVGGSRSGRSTLLHGIADQIAGTTGHRVALVRGKPVEEPPRDDIVLFGAEEVFALGRLLTAAERREFVAERGLACLPDGRLILLIDDAPLIEKLDNGSSLETALTDLQARSAAQVVAVTSAQAAARSPLTGGMRTSGFTVYLRPGALTSDVDDGWRVRSVSFQHRPGALYSRHDAILQTDFGQHVVHLIGSSDGNAG
ncbi:FtsK/SpoIIIE domain-containing protein [Micromonospora sp. WMMD712]|uniref:FtsK/SpoIIIE domain-containing protein n=1 Tax=Micromonospora sp. WMMD712 TaxID=3016096 RepID=UPI00249C32F3|nr:FtsK/SpoIIIE domain-containing protein [Micromonospora sp. WMMD712]WFE59216.1 FtsK/SpoIIIE domain-containing protein [Micromonospora sp. WMMD712]